MAEVISNPFARPELQQARSGAYEATQQATASAATATELSDALRDAVTERFSESPLHGQFQTAAQNFLTTVPQARAQLASQVQGGGPILNPNQQQSILAGRRAAAMVPLISLNDLIKSQTGGIENLVGAGTRAYQAQAQRLLGAADLANQYYKDVLNQLVTEEDIRARAAAQAFQEAMARANIEMEQQRFAESVRQFNAQQELNKLLGMEGIAVDREQLAESARQFDANAVLKRLTGGGSTKPTQSEIRSNMIQDLKDDVRMGATLNQVMVAYMGELDTNEILQMYNAGSPYGPAKESEWELYKMYGIVPPPESRTPVNPETQAESEKKWWQFWK